MTMPYEQADELDYLLLGTTRSPGKVKLSGHDRVDNWTVAKAKGQAGASAVLNGKDLGSFTATFTLTTAEDFEQWESFQKLIDSTVSGPKPIALSIYHPDLARNGYTEVTRAQMGGRQYDGQGGASHAVKFQEYAPPKPKAPAKAKASTTAPGGDKTKSKPDPNAAAKAKLAELLAEAKKP